MKMKEKRNLKLILFGVIILIAIIVAAIITCNFNEKIDNEKISAKETTSNIGITTEEKANSWDTSKLSEIIVDTSMVDSQTGETLTMYVPIPSGYTASKATSEDTVIEGLVIYEGTEEVNDSNVIDAKTTRNQYVWIPVNPEDVYWTDSDGKNWGVEYTFSNTGITATNSTTEPIIGSEAGEYYQDYYLDNYNSDVNTEIELISDIENIFNSMVESIKIYGGYFIGRYEVGDENATSRNSNSGTTDNAVEVQGKYVYNYITWFDAYNMCKQFSSLNENISTSLIFGTIWDNTLKFLISTKNKEYGDLIDSSGWGNYNNATFEYKNLLGATVTKEKDTRPLIPTGSTEYTNACNIYDLAGNASEWTIEYCSKSTIRDNYGNFYRGGSYIFNGTAYYACYRRGGNVSEASIGMGCRAVLWIK